MERLIVVSNRLPVTIEKKKGKKKNTDNKNNDKKSEYSYKKSVGGLTTGMASVYKKRDGIWIGWPGMYQSRLPEAEAKDIEKKLKTEFKCQPVFLSKKDVDDFYYGFCNRIVWPLFHSFREYTLYNRKQWEAYKKVNRMFADQVIRHARKKDIIWIHDYQLMLVPGYVREKLPEAKIGFFLHIPFPPSEIYRALPWRTPILKGLLGADVIGFHTYDYVRHFIEAVRRQLGYEDTFGQINTGSKLVKIDTFPMGIDYGKFENAAKSNDVLSQVKKIRKNIGNGKIILSIDRLDYSKGIPQRLEAFNLFLEQNPKYREKVTLIMVAVPSRTKVPQYQFLKKEVDELVSTINGKHGTMAWTPIRYLYKSIPFDEMVGLYVISDVCLVTPLKDGMNLIAKEYIASKTESKGTLVLSEMAGASCELGEALIVNPNNRERISDALKLGLEMDREEQEQRNSYMQRRLKRYNVERWANDFIESLTEYKSIHDGFAERKLMSKQKQMIIKKYRNARKRLIYLDYDGTLVPFAKRPEWAKPDDKLIEILNNLVADKNNTVVISSGRARPNLEKWFGSIGVDLVAEHGAWIKRKNQKWETLEPHTNEWKEEIRPVMELYVDRTPGSFIEEKDFSLVWHFRGVDRKLASVRSRELKNALLNLATNKNLGVFEGTKDIEIKNIDMNKGKTALRWIVGKRYGFIMGIGDAWTDEDIFTVLPKTAFSIKVGPGPTQARFTVKSCEQVRSLLNELGNLSQ